MKSEQLADIVGSAILRCRHRVLGVGDEQYSEGDTQKFEKMSPDELLAWAQEEADDLVVYGVMLGYRIQRIRQVLEDV